MIIGVFVRWRNRRRNVFDPKHQYLTEEEMKSTVEAVQHEGGDETEIEFMFRNLEHLRDIWEFGFLDFADELEGRPMNEHDVLRRLTELVWLLKGFEVELVATRTAIECRLGHSTQER
jgi:hypothetical protein